MPLVALARAPYKAHMQTVRIGIIGLGHAGSRYAQLLMQQKIRGACLAAVCTRTASRLKSYPGSIAAFTARDALLRSGTADAVIIATPHNDHVPTGIAALKAGLHVLVEKPIASRLSDARRLVAAHRNPRQVFAVMFNLRTDPAYARIQRIVRGGSLGPVQRIGWTFTEWYRTQAYYDSSSWRGTWRGEGGGALINQAPHHLDLLQWIFGTPARVAAFCRWGKHHRIEVEDEVTAYMEYANGRTASLVFSIGEAPGVNRLEVVGDRGALILDGRTLRLLRTADSVSRHTRLSRSPDQKPAFRETIIDVPPGRELHRATIQNFVNAIRRGTPLVAPAREALASLELANAMLLSAVRRRPIELPLDTNAFARAFRTLSAKRRAHP